MSRIAKTHRASPCYTTTTVQSTSRTTVDGQIVYSSASHAKTWSEDGKSGGKVIAMEKHRGKDLHMVAGIHDGGSWILKDVPACLLDKAMSEAGFSGFGGSAPAVKNRPAKRHSVVRGMKLLGE